MKHMILRCCLGGFLFLASTVWTHSMAEGRTILLNAGTGTCAETSLKESNQGSGVVLPEATPASAQATDGWVFAGWATSGCWNETTETPTLLTSGSNFVPTADQQTLYAVYSRTQGAVPGTLVQANSMSDIADGDKVVIVAERVYVSEDNNFRNFLMTQEMIYDYAKYAIFDNKVATIDANPTYYWTLKAGSETNQWYIVAHGDSCLYNASSSSVYISNESDYIHPWTISYTSNSTSNYYTITSPKTNNTLSCRNDLSTNKYNWNSYNKGCMNLSLYKYTPSDPGISYYHSFPGKSTLYEVTFSANGAQGDSPVSGHYAQDESVVLPEQGTMNKEKCDFLGWNTNPDATTILSSFTMPAENVTLYAIWQKRSTYHNLIYHYAGVSTACDIVTEWEKDNVITLPSANVVIGETFTGWKQNGTDATYSANQEFTMPNEEVILTAQYTPWTITFSFNGIDSISDVSSNGILVPSLPDKEEATALNNTLVGFTKTETYSAKNLPADLLRSGTNYVPQTTGEKWYAVYRQGDADYRLVKDVRDLRLDAHVVLASFNDEYAMGNTWNEETGTYPAVAISKNNDDETLNLFDANVAEWTLLAYKNYPNQWRFYNGSKCLAAPSGDLDQFTLENKTTDTIPAGRFRITIDAQGRATIKAMAHLHNTIHCGEDGFFACFQHPEVNLCMYQHIGTTYSTTATPVYRLLSAPQTCARLDGNDYYAEGAKVNAVDGYPNIGFGGSGSYVILKESDGTTTVFSTKSFTMPAFNVIDTVRYNAAAIDQVLVTNDTLVESDALTNKDIVLSNGKQLTIQSDVAVHDLKLNAGSSLLVKQGYTLHVHQLQLHGGLDSTSAEEVFDVPRIIIENGASLQSEQDSLDLFMSLDNNNRPFSLPLPAKVSDIRYAGRLDLPFNKIASGIRICAYNGEARGLGESTDTKYWQPLTSSDVLSPSTGYIIAAKRLQNETCANLRFRMKWNNLWTEDGEQGEIMENGTAMQRNQVAVGAWGVGTSISENNQGWNYVSNPYFSTLSLPETEQLRYATIPRATMSDYDQVPLSEVTLLPMSGFFVQMGESVNLTFPVNPILEAPQRTMSPEQNLYLRVTGNKQSDIFGLIIADNYTAQYDFNADLSKELGSANTLRAYTIYNDMKMAYLALNSSLLTTSAPIPVAVRVPEDGDYTFSLDAHSVLSDSQTFYLVDGITHANVDLSQQVASFRLNKGLCEGRFFIKTMETTPTDLLPLQSENMSQADKPCKYFYEGTLYIRLNDAVYNIQGQTINLLP